MPKIVLIGAGSYVFARDIITDVLLKPSLKDSSISLVDIDPERLNIMTAFTKKLVEQQGFKTRIDSTTDRKEALDGADYVITAIRAGGWKPVLENRLTALKYGLAFSAPCARSRRFWISVTIWKSYARMLCSSIIRTLWP